MKNKNEGLGFSGWAMIITVVLGIAWAVYRLFVAKDNAPVLVYLGSDPIPQLFALSQVWDLLLFPFAFLYLFAWKMLQEKKQEPTFLACADAPGYLGIFTEGLNATERSTTAMIALLWGGISYFAVWMLTKHFGFACSAAGIGMVMGQYARHKFPLYQVATIIGWLFCIMGPFIGFGAAFSYLITINCILVVIYLAVSLADLISSQVGKYWVE